MSELSIDKLAKDLLLDRRDQYIKKCLVDSLSKVENLKNRYEVTDKVIECLDNLNVIFPEVTGSCDVDETDYGFKIKLFKYYWERDWVMTDIDIKLEEINE
jgi:hypothetical protein